MKLSYFLDISRIKGRVNIINKLFTLFNYLLHSGSICSLLVKLVYLLFSVIKLVLHIIRCCNSLLVHRICPAVIPLIHKRVFTVSYTGEEIQCFMVECIPDNSTDKVKRIQTKHEHCRSEFELVSFVSSIPELFHILVKLIHVIRRIEYINILLYTAVFPHGKPVFCILHITFSIVISRIQDIGRSRIIPCSDRTE